MEVDPSSNPGLELFRRHPIYDHIFSYLMPLSLTRMASDFAARAYNINRRLSQFVSDPLIFCSLMARTHIFFDRTYYPDSDLDLYLHPDYNIIDVGRYLKQEGYKFIPRSWQLPAYKDEAEHVCANIDIDVDDIEDQTEASILYSLRSLREDGEVRVAQVIVSRVSPLASILDFHSSMLSRSMPFFGANVLSQTQDALAKYSARGWRVPANPSPLNKFLVRSEPGNPLYSPWLSSTPRSWVIQLDMDGVVPPPLPSASSQDPGWDPVAECGWQLYMIKWSSEVKLAFDTINATVFRWRYTAPSAEYIESLFPFLRSQGRMEHAKIPEGKKREDIADAWTW
ncbi:hypothetical protein L227DRAFT_583292 [Lentinus tigrinus ALCF2SS1-6]|uniref:Uncharacterized protein n=1 Tax=Lentinus tigrinus ALCF2SS1-6 TaxID=1328759 RepID=A0A5C2SNS4_9APHY|nr:hypothetical protein L227DRAFT_583292 [Lentinus tigrinus ALCF2SS1-6]